MIHMSFSNHFIHKSNQIDFEKWRLQHLPNLVYRKDRERERKRVNKKKRESACIR